MINRIACIFLFSTLCFSAVSAQVPLNVQLQIIKAEDARRYDALLENLMRSPNAETRRRSALAAGRIGRDEAVPELTRMLADRSARVRTMATFALGEIESMKAADAILQAIGETARAKMPGEAGGVDRSRLVEAAGKIAAANAKDPKAKDLARAVVFTLEAELAPAGRGDKETIMLGLTALLRARPEGAEETVRKFLSFTDPDIVGSALNTLARLRAKNANRDARDLLATHTHAIVRANAARVLGAAEDKEAVDVLIKAATSDPDSRVRVSAIRALAGIRNSKAARPLIIQFRRLIINYSEAVRRQSRPKEQNEILELEAALGRILANTDDKDSIQLIKIFRKFDFYDSPETEIAFAQIAPNEFLSSRPVAEFWQFPYPNAGASPKSNSMKTYSQGLAEISKVDDHAIRKRAEKELRELLEFIEKPKPATIQFNEDMLARQLPEMLRSFAQFKTDDLNSVLRNQLTSKAVFVRATAAELLAEQPVSQENLDSLNMALDYAIVNDTQYNDAVLATIDALFKLDKRKSLSALALASGSLDQVVRMKVLDLLKDETFKDVEMLPAMLRYADREHLRNVRPYSGKGTKLGQILNTDADYRRALSRKNGGIRAIVTTAKGAFTIDLLPEDAPLTVDNFVKLARSGYFNGVEVHRVVPNFVMQDGDPRGDGNGGPGWSIRCEINMVPYERGAVGMALSGKDTGGSQWFVTHSPQPHLDGGYTVFGKVNDAGMKVVDTIVRGDKVLTIRIVDGRSPQRHRGTERIRQ